MTKSNRGKKRQQGSASRRTSPQMGEKTEPKRSSSLQRKAEKSRKPEKLTKDAIPPVAKNQSEAGRSVPWGKIFIGLFLLSMFLGILETTLQAGRAVPNWPHSFRGFWIFCPPKHWFTQFDVFIAQTHRVAALATVIFVVIALVKKKVPRLSRLESLLFVALCLILPLSGGLRIAWDRTSWATVHACLAFAACVMLGKWIAGIAISKSDARGRNASGNECPTQEQETKTATKTSRVPRIVFTSTLVLLLTQSFVGAQLRHLAAETGSENLFTLWVWAHSLSGVFFLLVAAVCYWICVRTAKRKGDLRIAAWGRVLASLLFFQVFLGPFNWLVNYNVPLWFMDWIWPIHYTIQEGTLLQTTTTCTHVSVGYLSVVVAAIGWVITAKNVSPSNKM